MASANLSRPARDEDRQDEPRKRQRTENPKQSTYRKRSRSPDRRNYENVSYGRGDSYRQKSSHKSYRPSRDHDSQRGDSYRPAQRNDTYRPGRNQQARSDQRNSRPRINRDREQDRRSASPDSDRRSKKTKKERTQNPSTRIHSLRKQLARNTLPPNIQQERERELAALLFEQEKSKLKTQSKQNLSRYHFIRFIERQKAGRTLKKLQKRKEEGDTIWKPDRDNDECDNTKVEVGVKSEELEGIDIDVKIHELEVDLLYTQYAPLGDKYISLYASEDPKSGKRVGKAERYQGNWGTLKKDEMAILDPQQREELNKDSEKAAGLLELNLRASGAVGEDGKIIKPPVWYQVEDIMKDQTKLEALRDGKTGSGLSTDKSGLVVGLNSKASKAGEKRKPDWLDDGGVIDPADLDSDSDENMAEGGVGLNGSKSDDEEMSDGDGGFFEK